jgi:DUF4097 and DUF4098 domain-containing protein YvlB
MRLTRTGIVVVAVAAVGALGQPADAQRTRTSFERTRIDTTVPFESSGRLELELSAGEIRVNAWTRNEARIQVTSDSRPVSAVLSSSRIELDARGGTARYTITVPVGVSVAATTATGAIIVNGTRGNLNLETRSGSIDASEASGTIDVEATSGRITLQRLTGNVTVEGFSSNVTVSEIEGNLDIETLGGSARVDRANVGRLAFEAVSGSFDFSGRLGAGPHTVESHSGNITLRLPADFPATIALDTYTGELRPTDFSLVALPGSRGRSSDQVRFSINGGGAPITITTHSGDIVLRRIGANPQER